MSEFQSPQSPNPQENLSIPLSTNHSLSDERWRPPVRPETMDSQLLDQSNPTFIIDTSVSTNIDPSTIGMEGSLPNDWKVEVAGLIGIGGETADEPSYKIPIVKETINGNDTFSIMGVGEKGKPKVVHTFALDRPVHIGRSPEENTDIKNSETSVNLEQLGISDDLTVSRDHLTLTWNGSEIVVTDHSTNGTKIEAIEKRATKEKQLGNAVTSLSGGIVENVPTRKLIDSDSVPKSGEEASKILEEAETSRLEDKYQPALDALSEELNRLTEGLSTDDRLELRAYQNGDLLIRKGWEARENGIDYSSVGEQTKRDAYDKMSKKAQEVASRWSNAYSRYEEIQKLMRG